MSRYIPHDKMLKLREAAKNGDERARKILLAQLDDEADFSSDLDEYFKEPEPEVQNIEEAAETPQEQSKMLDTTKYDEGQHVPSQMHSTQGVITGHIPNNEISDAILALISSCDKKTIEVANNPEISDATKKGALSILQEIKQSCLENLEKFGKLMSSISKKIVEEEE